MTVSEPAGALWRKSSHSGAGNDCVEIALVVTGAAVRDSKNPDGPRLRFADKQWASFLTVTKQD
ncbi:DUF397 domain-containing protein [Actinocrispum wychmicini]|uniref:Uncharacterized protein DUF397 n=1 Tax=Actinocrispum wychmicini TaxID=1213861 RepID=A0A4R2JQV8_9PSEU|nr:DUF397 domain-containing protein [Actinocrispum wychmicini]TCO56565.1 uncharacterized protein DUF397 [Actinocrispum wychmicini]